MEPTLAFLFPDGASQAVLLAGGNGRTEVSVGRDADRTVEVDHPAVSRYHLRLVRGEKGWRAEDHRSANGTLRNGDPLLPGEPVDLLDGDCLAFGPDPAAVRAIYLHDPETVAESKADLGEEGDGDEFATVYAAAGSSPPFPEVGETLGGRYVLAENLGQTPEFRSYRAADTGNDDAPTSLKVFAPGALTAAETFPALVARVDRLRAIPSHPGVVRCLDARRERGRVFVVSRWVNGACPLLDLMRTRRALSPAEALRLLSAAAAASDHAAEHGLAPLDLSLRPTLLAVDPAPDHPAAWESLRHEPLERWPALTPRFAVALLAPLPDLGERLVALARFACEVLGRPLPEGARVRPPRIVHPALGEAGNEVLRGVLTAAKAPTATPEMPATTTTTTPPPVHASAQEFVTALVRASDLVPALAGG